MLTNPPEATTVGEILRVLEGSLSPVDCVDHPNCANSDHCVFPFHLEENEGGSG